jgi:hypothetical protein
VEEVKMEVTAEEMRWGREEWRKSRWCGDGCGIRRDCEYARGIGGPGIPDV